MTYFRNTAAVKCGINAAIVAEIIQIDYIRLISEISNMNFLEAKRLLENAPKSFASGKATDINGAIIKLKDAGINFTVTPEYPYLKE